MAHACAEEPVCCYDGSLRFWLLDFDKIADGLYGIHMPEGRRKVLLVPSRERALEAACKILGAGRDSAEPNAGGGVM